MKGFQWYGSFGLSLSFFLLLVVGNYLLLRCLSMIKASVASGWKEPFEQDRVEGMCPGDSYSGQSDSWLGSYSWDCHEDAHSRSPGASTVIDQTCPDVSGWHLSPHLHSGHTSQTGTKPGKVTKAASSWVTCSSSDSRLWFLDFPTALLSLSQAAEWSRRLWPNLFFFFSHFASLRVWLVCESHYSSVPWLPSHFHQHLP